MGSFKVTLFAFGLRLHSPSRLFSEHMTARIWVSLKDSTMDINNV
jgi:hypothetical protein